MAKLTRETIEHGIRVFTAQLQDARMSVMLCEKMLAELKLRESKLPEKKEVVVEGEKIPVTPTSVK